VLLELPARRGEPGAGLVAHGLILARATRAPLGALSCPYSRRDAARGLYEELQLHRSFRSLGPTDRGARNQCSTRAVDSGRWRDVLTTDYWRPPATENQHLRQRVVAVIIAFVLAVILAQAGW
jgi:hypothetical protein